MKYVSYYKLTKGLAISVTRTVTRTRSGYEIGFHNEDGYLGKVKLKK